MKPFGEGFTAWVGRCLDEFSEKIYEIDDGLASIEDNEDEIIAYLCSKRCAITLGMALRRYFCTKFGKMTETGGYSFTLQDGTVVTVSDYMRDDYDIENDNIQEFTRVFYDIYLKYNQKLPIPRFTKAEARRLLRMDSACQRKKMFEISFALHVTAKEMNKFLTDVLAEQTYNYRDPGEIIAYFCHSQEQYNSYAEYTRLTEKFLSEIWPESTGPEKKNNYTVYASGEVRENIHTEEELFAFLRENRVNFSGFSQTAYREFRAMYDKACELARIQTLSNDEYLSDERITNAQQRAEREERINRAIELKSIGNSEKLAHKLGVERIGNPEQLAHTMLSFIPRATFEKEQKGKTVVSADFISIANGEPGQKAKKIQTTKLPKDITMNLLMRDRLDDLLLQMKPVERKDLVFLKYFLFSLYLQTKESYTFADYLVFRDECDDMLMRCGMSRLYFANRFENLVLLSLLSANPFEMFENIIEYSFINEPAASDAQQDDMTE